MEDIRDLEKGDIVEILDPGDYYGAIGSVYETDGNVALISTIKFPEYLFQVGIWNIRNIKLIAKVEHEKEKVLS